MATKRMTRIEHMRDVVQNGYKKVQGKTVDAITASAYVQVYDNLSPKNQADLEDKRLMVAIDMIWRLIDK